MKIDTKSLKKLLGKSTDVAVYGLHSCRYTEVMNAVKNVDGIRLNDCLYLEDESNFIPPVAIDDGGDLTRRFCKAGLTSVLIENLKRSKEGKPLVALIYCVEMEEDGKRVQLDVERIAKLSGDKSSVTDTELRRCFKSYYEMNPEMREITEQTFKFVKVRQDDKQKDVYHLEQVKPFWHDPKWEALWKERIASKAKKNIDKKHPWREKIDKQFVLFNDENTNRKDKKKKSLPSLIKKNRARRSDL